MASNRRHSGGREPSVDLLGDMYERIKRKPCDGSLAEAIKVHSQACGFLAYVFDLHPDVVARAVRDYIQAADGVFV